MKVNNEQQFAEMNDLNDTTKNDNQTHVENNSQIKKRKRKLKEPLYFSFRHTIYLITLWVIFAATFIIGFIVHFDTVQNVTASSIMWTFSIILFVFCILYSYNYYRCIKAKTEEELQNYLKYFPC